MVPFICSKRKFRTQWLKTATIWDFLEVQWLRLAFQCEGLQVQLGWGASVPILPRVWPKFKNKTKNYPYLFVQNSVNHIILGRDISSLLHIVLSGVQLVALLLPAESARLTQEVAFSWDLDWDTLVPLHMASVCSCVWMVIIQQSKKLLSVWQWFPENRNSSCQTLKS